jgi:hypothetical protein
MVKGILNGTAAAIDTVCFGTFFWKKRIHCIEYSKNKRQMYKLNTSNALDSFEYNFVRKYSSGKLFNTITPLGQQNVTQLTVVSSHLERWPTM